MAFGESTDFKAREHQRGLNKQAQAQLHSKNIVGKFRGIFNQVSPLFEQDIAQFANQQGRIATQASNAAQAGFGRAGLGNTGLGASIGAGLKSGAAFRSNIVGNQIRSRLKQDVFQAAMQAQMAQFNMFAGQANAIQPFPPGGNMSFGGQVVAAGVETAANVVGAQVGGP